MYIITQYFTDQQVQAQQTREQNQCEQSSVLRISGCE